MPFIINYCAVFIVIGLDSYVEAIRRIKLNLKDQCSLFEDFFFSFQTSEMNVSPWTTALSCLTLLRRRTKNAWEWDFNSTALYARTLGIEISLTAKNLCINILKCAAKWNRVYDTNIDDQTTDDIIKLQHGGLGSYKHR